MATKVQHHIQRLEQKRDLLKSQVMEESGAQTRHPLEAKLRAVESAKLYRDALTERRLPRHKKPD